MKQFNQCSPEEIQHHYYQKQYSDLQHFGLNYKASTFVLVSLQVYLDAIISPCFTLYQIVRQWNRCTPDTYRYVDISNDII